MSLAPGLPTRGSMNATFALRVKFSMCSNFFIKIDFLPHIILRLMTKKSDKLGRWILASCDIGSK